VGQGKRIDPKGKGACAGEVELERDLFGAERGDDQTGGHPAHGGKHLHVGEILLRVGQLVQRERVPQGERRHISGAVGDEENVERREVRHLRQQAEQDPAEDAQRPEQLLRGEVAVGDEADEEGRDHRADSEGPIGQADLAAGELQGGGKVGAHAGVPASPGEVLEKHENREAKFDVRWHDIPSGGGYGTQPLAFSGVIKA